MQLRVAHAENIERCARLLTFPEFSAECVDFTNYLRIADGDFLWCDTNCTAILLMQCLDIVPSVASNVMRLQDQAGKLGIPRAWHVAERRPVCEPKFLTMYQQQY